jgi:membrane-bound ClpP family serine protease
MPTPQSLETSPAGLLPGFLRPRWVRMSLALLGLALLLTVPDLVFLAITHVLFGAVHLVWAVVHFVLGFVHLWFEHLLQEAFGMTRHGAQMATAWVGLVLIVAGAVWVGRKLWRAARSYAANFRKQQESGMAGWGLALSLLSPANPPRKSQRGAHLASTRNEIKSKDGQEPCFESES